MVAHAARVSAWGFWTSGPHHEVEGFHAFVLPGDALVEHQGVGDDGAGHAAGLGDVGHAQQPSYLPGSGGGQLFQFVQDDRCDFDSRLQSIGGLVHLLLGN